MIEPLSEDFGRASRADGGGTPESNQIIESPFLAALSVVERIVGYKLVSRRNAKDDNSDLVQEVAVRLLGWRARRPEKSAPMSEQDWAAYAARTTYNEVNRYYSDEKIHEPIEAALAVRAEKPLTGETAAELESVVRFVWQAICRLTARQSRALILNSEELVYYLLSGGIGEDELRKALSLDADEWQRLGEILPLSDEQIAVLNASAATQISVSKSSVNNVKKARFEARAKIKEQLEK